MKKQGKGQRDPRASKTGSRGQRPRPAGRSAKGSHEGSYKKQTIDRDRPDMEKGQAELDYPKNQIEGKNPVLEALKSGRTIEKILVARGSSEGSVREILKRAREKRLVIQEVDRSRLDDLAQSNAHQGIIAYVTPYDYVDLDHILQRARDLGEDPFIIVLDEITDPHNLGAIIRTAECSGVHGIVIQKRRSVGLTPAAIKASAGAVEYLPVAKVTNIATSLETLKKEGLWVAGADMGADLYTGQDLTGPIALVVGSEGHGLSRLVKEKCDFLVSIPQKGRVESLNASVAAGILMYEIVRQRG